jgi:hypothetical protein
MFRSEVLMMGCKKQQSKGNKRESVEHPWQLNEEVQHKPQRYNLEDKIFIQLLESDHCFTLQTQQECNLH